MTSHFLYIPYKLNYIRKIIKFNITTAVFVIILLSSCSGLERSEKEKVRRQNAQRELITRKSGETLYQLPIPKHTPRDLYPWEELTVGSHPRITKEYFRCKGHSLNKPRPSERDPKELYFDCRGAASHSLPLHNEEENIYPILIDLLNYLQEKTFCKVVITCGHRCPAHNSYSDSSIFNQSSKHMIGAEVDFYLEGMQENPQEVIDLLIDYYKDDTPQYREFQRYPKSPDVSIPPWYNKEVFLKLYQKDEGRDLDNQHPYPYLCIQVRYNRETQERVTYSWEQANGGFRRY